MPLPVGALKAAAVAAPTPEARLEVGQAAAAR